MAFPWAALIMTLGPILYDLLKGKGEGGAADLTRQVTTTTAPPMGYQSPTLGLQDLLMQGALGQNLQMFGGAGMPGGASIAPSFLQDFLDLIGSSYYDLQEKQQGPKKTKEGKYILSPDREIARKSYGNYAGR